MTPSSPAADTPGAEPRIAALHSVDEQDADPEHTAILQALVNRDRLEFLGG